MYDSFGEVETSKHSRFAIDYGEVEASKMIDIV